MKRNLIINNSFKFFYFLNKCIYFRSTPKKDCSSFLSSISAALATKCISIFRKTPKTNESKQEFFPNTDIQETTMSLETRNTNTDIQATMNIEPNNKSKTLVMDLDETLIFASKNKLDDFDYEIQVIKIKN